MTNHAAKRVLAVVSSTPEFHSTGRRTGLWLGELTHFYDVLVEAGHAVTIVGTQAGRVPIDPESLGSIVLKHGATDERYEDRAFMNLLADAPSIDDVADSPFDAIFLAGGHGAMYDFPSSTALRDRLRRMDEDGAVISAVCHGPAGFLGVTRGDGHPLVHDRKVTCFSWREEKLAGRDEDVPFRLDEALREAGASYTKALRPMASKVVTDHRLVTGQNPTSAKGVGEAVVKLLAKDSR